MFKHQSKIRSMHRSMIRERAQYLMEIAKEADEATNPKKVRHVCNMLEMQAIEIYDLIRMMKNELKYEREMKRQQKSVSGIAYAGMHKAIRSNTTT